MPITTLLFDFAALAALVIYSAQHDAQSDRAAVGFDESGKGLTVSDYQWHLSVWKFRWPLIVYLGWRTWFDAAPFGVIFQIALALAVLLLTSLHDFFYFETRKRLSRYADGKSRPRWMKKLEKFLREIWGIAPDNIFKS